MLDGSAADRWFSKAAGKKQGPLCAACLRQLIASQSIPSDTPVWHHGLEAWLPAPDCDVFADAMPLGGSAMGSGMLQLGGPAGLATKQQTVPLEAGPSTITIELVPQATK
jgi:hypothetical protein